MNAMRPAAAGRPLELEEAPSRPLGPHQVRIAVEACGVCRTDLHIIEGVWRSKVDLAFPHIMGHENAGWVEEVGPAVTHLKPGEPVICHPLITSGHCLACRRGAHRLASASLISLAVASSLGSTLSWTSSMGVRGAWVDTFMAATARPWASRSGAAIERRPCSSSWSTSAHPWVRTRSSSASTTASSTTTCGS